MPPALPSTSLVCGACRAAALASQRHRAITPARHSSTTSKSPSPAELLRQPTWSVRSLLPPTSPSSSTPPQSADTTNAKDAQAEDERITPTHLHHLLRLSALPLPSSPAHEAELIATLSSQLHFVRAVQAVDTTGVEPLRAIRDESAEGMREIAVGLGMAQVREALAEETPYGSAKRPRRRFARPGDMSGVEGWDPLGMAGERSSGHFVVKTERPKGKMGESQSSQSSQP